jgi:hypothetical protein
MRRSSRSVLWQVGLFAAVAVASCASGPEPSERMEGAAGAIRSAEEVGARSVPRASLHLQLAREQSDHAKELITNGEKEAAASLLLRAQADAELAVALVRETEDRSAAQQAIDRVKTLQESTR